jgi:hypothetical protein
MIPGTGHEVRELRHGMSRSKAMAADTTAIARWP